MDSFTITHYQHLFPVDEFKVQEVISQEYLEYGAHVENSSLVSCLKNFRFSEESELYEQAELYMANHYNKVNVGCFPRKSIHVFLSDSYDRLKGWIASSLSFARESVGKNSKKNAIEVSELATLACSLPPGFTSFTMNFRSKKTLLTVYLK